VSLYKFLPYKYAEPFVREANLLFRSLLYFLACEDARGERRPIRRGGRSARRQLLMCSSHCVMLNLGGQPPSVLAHRASLGIRRGDPSASRRQGRGLTPAGVVWGLVGGSAAAIGHLLRAVSLVLDFRPS
jgi:hypothetical protein